jgi:Asp-tRNA(Asn)/Glu-tRNA(Gln) amidotransferase A subunit family amidase
MRQRHHYLHRGKAAAAAGRLIYPLNGGNRAGGRRRPAAFHVMSTTVPFNLTGLPALSMRFGTTSDGMPIGVQLAASWHAESTILYIASLLESLSPVRDQHPAL